MTTTINRTGGTRYRPAHEAAGDLAAWKRLGKKDRRAVLSWLAGNGALYEGMQALARHRADGAARAARGR